MKRRTRRTSNQNKVFIKDWMAFRPYSAHSDYDLHYLRIANKIYKDIFVAKYAASFALELPNPKMLACIIASYYEDYICEIGIWKGFTAFNKELYGYHLPFYENEGYDPDYINPEDITYLLWHFCSKWGEHFFAPDYLMFKALGEMIYQYLEPLLDEALATDFYKSFYQVNEDEDFFDVKERLRWFAEGSYLFGADFYLDRKEKIRESFESDSSALEIMGPEKLVYTILEEYIYQRRSSFSALKAPEFFARVARCSDSVREDIIGLGRRHVGSFLYEGEEGEYIIFSNIQTSREYKVRRDSFQEIPDVALDNKIVVFSVVQWRGEWWMTGTASFLPKSEKNIELLQKERLASPYLRTEEQMQKARESTEIQYQVFTEYFGGPLATFSTRREANEGLHGFFNAHRAKVLAKKPEFQGKAPPPLEGDFVKDIPETGGIGLFFNRGEGLIFISGILDTIQLLEQEPPLGEEEAEDLFYTMTGYQPPIIAYLLDHYPTHNLRVPIKGCDIDLARYIWFVNRFEHPDDFGEVFPNITMLKG